MSSEEDGMRLLAIALLTAGLATAACGGTETGSAAANGSNPITKVAEALSGSHDVTIPAGTQLTVVLDTPVGSDTSELEEAVQGHLAAPVIVEGQTVADAGSGVSGVVTSATKSAKVKGRAHVAVRFDTLQPSGQDGRYTISTSSVGRTAAATKKKDAWEIAGPAAGGALIGALVG